ncbi:MAG: polysaccharide pyruvyl transferase family protein [Mariprofundaceae bacterium]
MAARRVVLQGWFGMNNFGDDLLLEITLSHLLKTVDHIHIDVIGEGKTRPPFLPASVGYLPRASRKWSWFRKRWLRSGCDWVLCGGSILKADVLQRFIEPACQVKKAGGRVFLHAIGLREHLDVTPELRRFMNLVDGSSVREQEGWNLLSQLGSVELVADPVFAMEMHSGDGHSGRVLIALRGTEEAESYIDDFAKQIVSMKGEITSIDVLVCFPQQDIQISKRLVKALDGMNVRLIDGISAVEKANMVAAADRVITMRLHPAIVALTAGVIPWVLAPEHKHRALMEDIGKQEYLLDWNQTEQALTELTDDSVDMEASRLQGSRSLDLLTGWIADG